MELKRVLGAKADIKVDDSTSRNAAMDIVEFRAVEIGKQHRLIEGRAINIADKR